MAILFVSFISNAQTNTKNDRPVITKGYYSIGNHAEKLPTPVALKGFPGQPTAQKGYYSSKSNRKKLSTSSSIDMPKSRTKVTKGYYSIGDHNKKLK